MELAIRMLGALVVTYVLSRILLLVLGAKSGRGIGKVIAAHILCFAAIATTVGLLRTAYSFEVMAAVPYVLPQIFWLALDIMRKRR